MQTKRAFNSVSRGWPVLLAGSAAITPAFHTEAADWTKHFRVGMQVTLNIEADFSGGGFFDIQTRPGQFDDGFVLRDNSTPTPEPDEQLTTNWGYQRASQVTGTGTGRTMTFTRTESFESASTSSSKDDSPYLGLELAYGTAITRWGDALIGWEAGYSFLPISISESRSVRGTANRFSSTHRVPDAVVLPDPPYSGSATAQSQATIFLEPLSTEEFQEDVTAQGSRSLDVSLHTVRVGPTIHLELARRWAFQGGLGPAIGFVTGDYKFDERATIPGAGTSNRAEGEFGADEFVYGGYAQALLLFHFEEHGDIYAGLQFMGLTGADFEEGDRSAKLNLGATLSFLVGINWPF